MVRYTSINMHFLLIPDGSPNWLLTLPTPHSILLTLRLVGKIKVLTICEHYPLPVCMLVFCSKLKTALLMSVA